MSSLRRNYCALLLLLAAVTASSSGCKRHRRGASSSARYAGPELGSATSVIRATRLINPQRVATTAAFDTVIALPTATLGIAGGRLYRLGAAQVVGGVPLDPFAGRTVRLIAAAGGDVVYALVNGDRPFIARTTDAGATWVSGANVSEGSVPTLAIDPRLDNPETTPGLAAAGQIVVFWIGENAIISRDGGSTAAPIALGGYVRSLAVTDVGTVVALVRDPEADDGPGFNLVRADARGLTRTLLQSANPCTAAKLRRLSSGALLLADSTHMLGICARLSRDDGRTFADYVTPAANDATRTQLRATGSGVLVRSLVSAGAPLLSFSQDNGVTLSPVPKPVVGMPFDIAVDNTIAVGLSDALVRLPGTHEPDAAAQFEVTLRSDARFTMAFAAARDAIATLDPRGAITVVTPGHDGPELHRFQSPCRFPGEQIRGRDIALVALDGRGHVCCASRSGGYDGENGSAACAEIGSEPVAWRTIPGSVDALASGDGAIAVTGSEPRCILDGEPASAQPIAVLGLPANTTVREASCSRNGTAAAAFHTGDFTIFTPFQLRSANARARHADLEPAVGRSSHVIARSDGTVVAAFESATGMTLRQWRAENGRPLRSWQAEPTMLAPSVLAIWDDHATILSMRTALVVASPAGFARRAFAEDERYEAVARVGDALVGVTHEGRFAVLEAR